MTEDLRQSARSSNHLSADCLPICDRRATNLDEVEMERVFIEQPDCRCGPKLENDRVSSNLFNKMQRRKNELSLELYTLLDKTHQKRPPCGFVLL